VNPKPRLFEAVDAHQTQILTLFAQRPIVEKHTKYAFYHPFSEAIASMICDLPNKIGTAVFFNITLYFITVSNVLTLAFSSLMPI
jgi:ABC-type multidrug transport system permease subunit